MSKIELVCDNQDASNAAQCEALRHALSHQVPKADIVILPTPDTEKTDALRIHLQILRRAPDFVIARLVWSAPGGPTVTGPEVEISIVDTNLTNRAQKQLAQGLLQVSDLPI